KSRPMFAKPRLETFRGRQARPWPRRYERVAIRPKREDSTYATPGAGCHRPCLALTGYMAALHRPASTALRNDASSVRVACVAEGFRIALIRNSSASPSYSPIRMKLPGVIGAEPRCSLDG